MIELLLSAMGIYIATSIDYLIVLTILFAELPHKKWHMYIGQYLGTGTLVTISLIAAYVVHFIPQDWMVGLLGFIPLYLGLRFGIRGSKDDSSEEDFMERLGQNPNVPLFLQVAFFTVISGGDNISIYVPYFTSLTKTEMISVIFLFIVNTFLLCRGSQALAAIPTVSQGIERYERRIVSTALIIIGLYILYDNHTIQTLWNYLMS